MSWNVGMNHMFSYPHEIADLEPSVSFPMGSPAIWNSRTLAQTKVDDASGMRKKWSSAHNRPTVSNSSHDHSHKNMSKRFKPLLKFGRKSHGIDNVTDWIPVTTSEGDDDNDDGMILLIAPHMIIGSQEWDSRKAILLIMVLMNMSYTLNKVMSGGNFAVFSYYKCLGSSI